MVNARKWWWNLLQYRNNRLLCQSNGIQFIVWKNLCRFSMRCKSRIKWQQHNIENKSKSIYWIVWFIFDGSLLLLCVFFSLFVLFLDRVNGKNPYGIRKKQTCENGHLTIPTLFFPVGRSLCKKKQNHWNNKWKEWLVFVHFFLSLYINIASSFASLSIS